VARSPCRGWTCRHEIRIPPGIQSGKQLRQRGAGMPVLNGRGQGDMVVQIEVETPTKLTARQKELLEEFRATETGEECPQASGFFTRLKGMEPFTLTEGIWT
jgi:molecular chaperone DnaJ